jgi:tetratricopeptide (TPR) repeat protein
LGALKYGSKNAISDKPVKRKLMRSFLLTKNLATFISGVIFFSGCSIDQKSPLHVVELERNGHEEFRKGNWKMAQKEDEDALRVDKNNPELLNNLAVILDHEGDRRGALEYIKRAESLSPDNAMILQNRARLELEIGNEGKALEIAQKILSQEKWPDGFRTLMGKIDIDLARYNEAHLYLHEAFERHPLNPLILTYLGIVHYRIGDYPESRKDFAKALTLHPSKGLRHSLILLLKDPEGTLDRERKNIPGLSGSIQENKKKEHS